MASILRCAPPGEVPSRKVLLMAVKRLGSGGVRLIACATALEAAGTVPLPLWAHAGRVTPPAVPANIQVPAGSKPLLAAHASGTHDYICLLQARHCRP